MATVIKLSEVLSVAGQKYESLTFRSFQVDYLKYVTEDVFKIITGEPFTLEGKVKAAIAMVPLLAALCEVPEEVIKKMAVQDMASILDKFGTYFNSVMN